MVYVKDNGRAAVVIDGRYAPIFVSCFFGDTDLELGQWYEEQHAQMVIAQYRLGRRAVNISDATFAAVPNAQMRHFWAAMAERHAARLQGMTIFDSVVVTNPWARGALTAVSWLSPRVSKLKIHPSLEAALSSGLSTLTAASSFVPAFAAPYRLPPEALAVPLVRRTVEEGSVK